MPTEPGWLLIVVYLGAGFFLLGKGADWLVGGSSQVAQRFGVSKLVVGLTIVAFGTSAPEIVVSSLAAAEGKADLSIGNVLGSNVANVGLVLGLCAIVLPKVLESHLSLRELFWFFSSIALLWWMASDSVIGRMEAAMLFAVFVVYNLHMIAVARDQMTPGETRGKGRYPALKIAAGITCVALGAKLVVMGAESGALRLGIPGSVVGLTVLAIGTSLPELAAGLGGALRGESDISLGNVVGSNVFNLLAVIGIVGLIHPLDPETFSPENAEGVRTAFRDALSEDFYVVLGFSVALVGLPHLGGLRAGRTKGAVLLLGYVGYIVWLYVSRG